MLGKLGLPSQYLADLSADQFSNVKILLKICESSKMSNPIAQGTCRTRCQPFYVKNRSLSRRLLLLKQSGQDRKLIKMKTAKEKRDHDIGFLCRHCIVAA